MLAAGIAPDAISYTSLLKACSVAGDAPRAERLWVEMQQRTNHFSTYVPPTPHAYAHLMAVQVRPPPAAPPSTRPSPWPSLRPSLRPHPGARRSGDLGLQPSPCARRPSAFALRTPPFPAAPRLCAPASAAPSTPRSDRAAPPPQRRAGNVDRVLELLAELRARRLAPATVHYSLALRACELHASLPDQLARALALFDELRAAGLCLDSRGLLALARICEAQGRPDLAAQMRQERSVTNQGAKLAGKRAR
jgi:pentatricopeptide repeat protein